MLLDIYKECLFNRYFEHKVEEYLDKKIVNPPVYLSVGTEYIPVILKYALKALGITKYNIFAQHRCHSYYNTFIQEPLKLALELCGSPDGCNEGMGGSASIAGVNGDVKMWGHDGLLGTNASIAVGYAKASNELCICILGDAAVEEDYVLGALGYAGTHKLPILFIVEDNNLSILTEKKIRRSWNICSVAQSMGVWSDFIYENRSIEWIIKEISTKIYSINELKTPYLLNIQCCRHYWHAGSGKDGAPKYDYLIHFENELKKQYSSDKLLNISDKESEKIDIIWQQSLKLLNK